MNGSGGTQGSDSDKSFFCAGPRNPSSIEEHLQGTSTQSPSTSAVAAPEPGPSAEESVPRGRPLQRGDARAREVVADPSTEPAGAAGGPEPGPSNVHGAPGGSAVVREQAARLNLPPSAPIDIPERNSRMTEEDEELTREADDERNYRSDVLNLFTDLIHDAGMYPVEDQGPAGPRLYRLFVRDTEQGTTPTRTDFHAQLTAEQLFDQVHPIQRRRNTYEENVRAHAQLLVFAVNRATRSATPSSAHSGSLDFSGMGSDEGHHQPQGPFNPPSPDAPSHVHSQSFSVTGAVGANPLHTTSAPANLGGTGFDESSPHQQRRWSQ